MSLLGRIQILHEFSPNLIRLDPTLYVVPLSNIVYERKWDKVWRIKEKSKVKGRTWEDLESISKEFIFSKPESDMFRFYT